MTVDFCMHDMVMMGLNMNHILIKRTMDDVNLWGKNANLSGTSHDHAQFTSYHLHGSIYTMKGQINPSQQMSRLPFI